MRPAKKINPHAYNALADALSLIYWNKTPFQRYVRGMLKDNPEILSVLDFEGETKRETAGRIVDFLRGNERRYLDLSLAFMLNISALERFPNLLEQADAQALIAKAERAVVELRKWTSDHAETVREHETHAREIADAARKDAAVRAFSESLSELRARFFALERNPDPHVRGHKFEDFLNELFGLFDLEPRASYSMEHEQIDGAFSFDTDDYVIEAKWHKAPIGRSMLDVFKTNVDRKARNTLGLYISMSGFTSDALQVYSYATCFITMDGADFMAVLDQRIRLTDLIRRKKRYASETGHCYFPASMILGS